MQSALVRAVTAELESITVFGPSSLGSGGVIKGIDFLDFVQERIPLVRRETWVADLWREHLVYKVYSMRAEVREREERGELAMEVDYIG
jgi:hypothetical protein